MRILDALHNDELTELALTVATPEALEAMLKQRPEVIAVRRALDDGRLLSGDIEEFVFSLVNEFQPAGKFSGDIILSAPAAALETLPGKFAESFLRDLSSLRVRELPMGPRVASIARRERNRIITCTTLDKVTLSMPLPPTGASIKESKPIAVQGKNSNQVHRIAA